MFFKSYKEFVLSPNAPNNPVISECVFLLKKCEIQRTIVKIFKNYSTYPLCV